MTYINKWSSVHYYTFMQRNGRDINTYVQYGDIVQCPIIMIFALVRFSYRGSDESNEILFIWVRREKGRKETRTKEKKKKKDTS